MFEVYAPQFKVRFRSVAALLGNFQECAEGLGYISPSQLLLSSEKVGLGSFLYDFAASEIATAGG